MTQAWLLWELVRGLGFAPFRAASSTFRRLHKRRGRRAKYAQDVASSSRWARSSYPFLAESGLQPRLDLRGTHPAFNPAMRKVMECLLNFQRLQFATPPVAESEAEMGRLRKRVPAPIMSHYERLAVRGRKGVSLARNGVCSECHLRIPGGKLIGLAHADEVHLCDNCGRYLYLPAEELQRMMSPPPPVKPPSKRSSRKTAVHVA